MFSFIRKTLSLTRLSDVHLTMENKFRSEKCLHASVMQHYNVFGHIEM